MNSLRVLLQRATIVDHEEMLKACDLLLEQSKGDIEAQRIKCLALLKLERYHDALAVLEQGGENVEQHSRLEKAYALYKTGNLRQAKELTKQIASRGARHVEAQASYRLEEFEDAASLYKALEHEAAVENEENDLRINSGATSAQLEWQRKGHLVEKRQPSRADLEAFETVYNAACAFIARNRFGQAEILLKRAKDLCSSLDDLSENEKATEVLPITIQQLFILKKLGKSEEAVKLASDIALQGIPELSTRQIAQNNKLAASPKLLNPYLAQRLFESVTTVPEFDKLFRFQADLIQENGLTLDLLALKYPGVVEYTATILSSHVPTISAHINKISVLKASAHAQNQLGKLGLKPLLPLVEKRPHDIGLVLVIMQLYVLTNNPGSAITVLESLLKRLAESSPPIDQDIVLAPGLIATLVSLYTAQGRKSQIQAILAKAASHWRHKSKPPVPLLEAAGLALLKSQSADHQTLALEIFSSLRSFDPTSRFATAGYVAAHSLAANDDDEFSSSPPPETNQLIPVSRLTAGIDAAALEATGIAPRTSTDSTANIITASSASRKRALDEPPPPAKKRIRKSRLPKSLDPTKTPDPERWLPLRDRSSYKPKGKKGRQKAAALTQGGAVVVNAGGGGSAAATAAPAPAIVSGSRSGNGAGAEAGAGGSGSRSGPPAKNSEGVIKAGNNNSNNNAAGGKSKKKKGGKR